MVSDSERIKATVAALRQVLCSESLLADLDDAREAAGYASPEPDCTEVVARIDEGPDAGQTYQTLTGPDVYRQVGQGIVLSRATNPRWGIDTGRQAPPDPKWRTAPLPAGRQSCPMEQAAT